MWRWRKIPLTSSARPKGRYHPQRDQNQDDADEVRNDCSHNAIPEVDCDQTHNRRKRQMTHQDATDIPSWKNPRRNRRILATSSHCVDFHLAELAPEHMPTNGNVPPERQSAIMEIIEILGSRTPAPLPNLHKYLQGATASLCFSGFFPLEYPLFQFLKTKHVPSLFSFLCTIPVKTVAKIAIKINRKQKLFRVSVS
jgi:hypothetical protein